MAPLAGRALDPCLSQPLHGGHSLGWPSASPIILSSSQAPLTLPTPHMLHFLGACHGRPASHLLVAAALTPPLSSRLRCVASQHPQTQSAPQENSGCPPLAIQVPEPEVGESRLSFGPPQMVTAASAQFCIPPQQPLFSLRAAVLAEGLTHCPPGSQIQLPSSHLPSSVVLWRLGRLQPGPEGSLLPPAIVHSSSTVTWCVPSPHFSALHLERRKPVPREAGVLLLC